jgi:hypothetical protein
MQTTTTMTTQRAQNEQARARALVRFNGLTFHSLAAASFLERAVPAQVGRLAGVFAAYPDVCLWLEQIWWPQRAELGRQLCEYVEATWPEFDWNAARDEFGADYRSCSGLLKGRGVPAFEALALCATAAQAALFYRTLAACADEPLLRELARKAACDHAGFFDYFRALFDRCRRSDPVGFSATWRTVVALSRSVRDNDVAGAFTVLGRHWKGTAICPGFDYPEYRTRMARLIRRYAGLGLVERLLFRPWLEQPRVEPALHPVPVRSDGGWRPALQPA